jgi:hypothetical protein
MWVPCFLCTHCTCRKYRGNFVNGMGIFVIPTLLLFRFPAWCKQWHHPRRNRVLYFIFVQHSTCNLKIFHSSVYFLLHVTFDARNSLQKFLRLFFLPFLLCKVLRIKSNRKHTHSLLRVRHSTSLGDCLAFSRWLGHNFQHTHLNGLIFHHAWGDKLWDAML